MYLREAMSGCRHTGAALARYGNNGGDLAKIDSYSPSIQTYNLDSPHTRTDNPVYTDGVMRTD